ncbi:hypothetical protein HYX15_00080 [Candidatus Woesearchaeota archaeon]|nr:hypothetical protein [Candidatus Woesearchaeota archaeon]
MVEPKIRKSSELERFDIDPILKLYLSKYLDGKIIIPGVKNREIRIEKLYPGVHLDGMVVENIYSEDYEIARKSKYIFGIGSHPSTVCMYNLFVHVSYSFSKEPKEVEWIILRSLLNRYILQSRPGTSGREYSSEENIILDCIAEQLRIHRNGDCIYALGPNSWDDGFRPINIKKIHERFRRVFLGVKTMDEFIRSNSVWYGDRAKSLIEQMKLKLRI